MPNKCCVPGCKSNYNTKHNNKHVSLFSFPKDLQLRQLWLRKIPRSNFEPSKYSFVCIKHFDERFIDGEISFQRPDGSYLKVKRVRPVLVPNAYPTIFPNGGSRVGANGSFHNVARKRTAPVKLKGRPRPIQPKISQPSVSHVPNEESEISCLSHVTNHEDAINTYDNLLDSIDKRLATYRNRGWCYLTNEDEVVITNLAFDSGIPMVTCALKIKPDLSISMILGAHEVTQDELELMGWNDSRISSWNQILHCMQLLKSSSHDIETPLSNDLEGAIAALQKIYTDIQAGRRGLHRAKDATTLAFIIEQLEMISKKPGKRKYSCEFCFWCLSLLLNNPTAYEVLKDTEVFNMPPPDRIFRRLITDVNAPRMTNTQFTYLEKRAKALSDDKRIVIVQVYDLPVTSSWIFEDGPLSSCVSRPLVKKPNHVVTFMIASAFCDFREIALVVPIETLDEESVYSATRNVIMELEKMGFRVLAIIADNTRTYGKMFAKISGKPEVSICVPNPSDPSRPLFLLFDPAHILKCIRDDWIDKKTLTQTYIYPHPDVDCLSTTNSSLVQRADFAIVKSLYNIDKRKDWAHRKAKNLTCRTLIPTKADRLSMELVLNLFDEATVSALEALGPIEQQLAGWEGTALFIKTIVHWWKTIGGNGTTYGDGLAGKVESMLDPCMKFFDDLIVWLNRWDEMTFKDGGGMEDKVMGNVSPCFTKLNSETAIAFEHTLHGLREILAYLLTEVGVRSVYLSRFRKDFPLSRFTLTGSQPSLGTKLLIMLKSENE